MDQKNTTSSVEPEETKTTKKATGAAKSGKQKKDIQVKYKQPLEVVKRDGRKEPFESSRIKNAIERCFQAIESKKYDADELTQQVVNIVSAKYEVPNVEQVQDIVEMVLQAAGEYEAAKRYILYRAEHAKMRETRPVPEDVKKAFDQSDKYFPSQIQKFQFYDKYARFSYEQGRR